MVVEEEEVVVEVGVAPDVDDEDVEDVGPAGAEEEGEVVVSSWLLLLPPTEPESNNHQHSNLQHGHSILLCFVKNMHHSLEDVWAAMYCVDVVKRRSNFKLYQSPEEMNCLQVECIKSI